MIYDTLEPKDRNNRLDELFADEGITVGSEMYTGQNDDKTRLVLQIGREDLLKMGYPVMVECWERVMGSGSRRRRYHEMFTEAERRLIGRYHTVFRRWHLQTGTPAHHVMRLTTHALLVRAISFFAMEG
jgi:hypothetical protein